jgi:hypothetical protein
VRGLSWTAVIWILALTFAAPQGLSGFRKTGRIRMTRAQFALLLVLLGSHSFAAPTTAEEVLADPVVIERVIRGGLSLLAILIVIPALIRPGRKLTSKSTTLGILTFYGVFAAATSLYSVAPIVTFGKVIELSAGLAAIWAIRVGSDPEREFRDTIRMVILLEGALVAVAVIGFILVPGEFLSGDNRPGFITANSMGSPYTHPNSLSAIGALMFAYGASEYFESSGRRARLGWITFAIFGTLGILFASGRQGLVIWLVSAAVVLLIHRRKLLLFFIGPATAIAVVVNSDTLWGAVTRDQAAVNVTSWSGRWIWWGAALEVADEHLLTGFGFGAGGRWAALKAIGADTASSLHSGYMEALLGVGLLGSILLIWASLRVAWWSGRKLLAGVDTAVGIIIVPLLLHTFVSLGFGGWINSDLILFACLAGLSDVARRFVPPAEKALAPLPANSL